MNEAKKKRKKEKRKEERKEGRKEREEGRKDGRKETDRRMHCRVGLIVRWFHEWLSANEGPQIRNSRVREWPGVVAGASEFMANKRGDGRGLRGKERARERKEIERSTEKDDTKRLAVVCSRIIQSQLRNYCPKTAFFFAKLLV